MQYTLAVALLSATLLPVPMCHHSELAPVAPLSTVLHVLFVFARVCTYMHVCVYACLKEEKRVKTERNASQPNL